MGRNRDETPDSSRCHRTDTPGVMGSSTTAFERTQPHTPTRDSGPDLEYIVRNLIPLFALQFACNLTSPPPEQADADTFNVTTYGDEKPDNLEPTEGWSNQDDPTLFTHELDFDVDALPMEGEADNVPWASSYWPVYEDSINFRWDGDNSMSPSEKYGEAFGIEDFADKVSEHHGIDNQSSRTECESNDECNSDISEKCAKREGEEKGYCIPSWWGICHAWAPVAILEPEPQQAVTINDVEFKVNDIKALATLGYNRTTSRFVSLRCNEDDSQDEIEYDGYDRPTGDDEECRDTNPGTYHVLLTNFLGLKGQSFVEDRTFDDEVWNQPLRGYRITQMEPISVERAHTLIGVPEDEEPTAEVGGTYGFTANLDQGEWLHKGPYAVNDLSEIKVNLTGDEGDADLYVRFGAEPTENEYDCRPYKPHANESCILSAGEEDAELYVSVYGYEASESEAEVIIVDPNATQEEQAVEYEFNDDAESFYHVKLEVDYMTESDSDVDGNLADSVDNYTRTDRYQYVLEIDADNQIIGGEWVGSSKRNHPDFLWLPTGRSNWPKPAGGKLNWDLVKDLIDQSQIQEEPEVDAATGVVETTESLSLEKSEWKELGPFVVGGSIEVTMTGDNDADLYLRKDTAPTSGEYDCRPYSSHSNEECKAEGAGSYYVAVNGYTGANVELHITYEGEGASSEPASPSTHIDESGSVDFQEMALYVLQVSAGDTVKVATEAGTDIDLYIRFDNPPTTEDYDARGYTTSGNERIDFDANADGMLHIGVHGWAEGDFTLTTTDR